MDRQAGETDDRDSPAAAVSDAGENLPVRNSERNSSPCGRLVSRMGDDAMNTLRLAIDLVDRAVEAAEQGELLDPRQEAEQLLRRHPEAENDFKEVAETLCEEAAAAGAELRRGERQPW